jgi:hypothetical protein
VITTKKELYEYMIADNNWLKPIGIKDRIVNQFARYPSFVLRKYLRYLRKQEYYINTANNNKLKGLLGLYYERKKNVNFLIKSRDTSYLNYSLLYE